MDHTYNPTSNLWTRSDFSGIGYSDGQSFEFGLLETIRNSGDRSVFSAELQGKMGEWRSEYHLTPARHCLLRPLQFAPGESLLELGCGCGAITRYLGERGLNVTAVEGGAPRAAITAERCRDLPNVRVMLDDLVQFESDQQFDWVTLIGVLEYSPYFAPGPDPVLAYLQQALRYLKPGGRLVIAIENQLGLKYFNGCGEDHQGTPFFGPNNLYGDNTAVTFGKERLEEILRQAGCQSVEFLYPFPDYKIPSAIVSDRAFHTPGFSVADLLLRTEARDYAGRNRRLFSEQLVARTLEDNHVLQHFANSFLIVAARDATRPCTRADELAWCFAPGRQAAFRTETTFTQEAVGAIRVSKTHLGPVSADGNRTGLAHQLGATPYVRGRLMAWPMLKAKLQVNAEQELITAYLPYAHHLLSNSCPLAGQDPLQLANWETAGRHIDLTPFNLVQDGDQITAIDEEWALPQPIPAGWVLLRAIIQTSALSVGRQELAKSTLESLLIGITAQLGLRVERKHIDAWLAREADFLKQATGRKLRQPTAQTPLLELSANRLVDLDDLRSEGSGKSGVAVEPSEQATLDAQYRQWLARRSFVSADAEIIERSIAAWKSRPVFQILLRLEDGQQAQLADTFESLNHQFYGNWRVDVVSTLPAPAGIEEVANIGWHSIPDAAQGKATLDLLQVAHSCDWILEIPPGTILDPLCLWRIGHEADRTPDALAFYVDDDLASADGNRSTPRFKSGLNVEWLRSADIVGPLFVSRKALRRAGGVAEIEGGAWYDLLLRLLESVERQQIRHIADVLLSYREAIPAAPEACMYALARHLTRLGEAADVSPSSPHSWSVIYHATAQPKVSIIIPSSHSLEFLQPCLDSLLDKTAYADYEILVVSTTTDADADCRQWLADRAANSPRPLRLIEQANCHTPSQAYNLGAIQAAGEMLLLLREDTRILQEHWLDELVKQGLRPGIGAVTPRLVQPHSGLLENIGYVFGLGGLAGSPHRGKEKFSAAGFMNQIQLPGEVSAAPLTCLLVSRQRYAEVGGLDAEALPFSHADVDFSLKLRQRGHTLVYCPAVTVVHYGNIAGAEFPPDPVANAIRAQQEAKALATVQLRWPEALVGDDRWNLNLSLENETPAIDAQILPTWRYLPGDVPRILARPLPNGQGQYRLSLPLRAARAATRAQSCEILQDQNRAFNPLEIARLGADSFIVQHFLTDSRLGELHQYRKFAPDAFIVYACDDLLTDMPRKSHFRRLVPADSRTRFKAALKACDRLVVSTPFLAEAFRHFIDDIRVVPNRIERATWLSLNSKRRVGPRPRIGWAGGTGHQGDLELLKPVIEATRDEADWVFFGMCPDELRPLLAEYHELADFNDYPRKLAALSLDLAVAPLEDIPFNHGKSNLRLIEYGALGLPVICSDVTPYRDSPVLRLANDPQRWIAALRERLHDLDAAEREGQALKQWVQDSYVLEDHLDEWLQAHLPKS
jgi:O-antigen biosynthesis protein